MAEITIITAADIFNGASGIDTMPGYCLVDMKVIYLGWPADVQGSLYTCPCCGLLDTKKMIDQHVFNPSAQLITALELGKP